MKRPSTEADDLEINKKNKISENEDLPVDTESAKERREMEKKLSEMIRFKKKYVSKKPKFILTLDNVKSDNSSSAGKSDDDLTENYKPQFYVQDLQRVLLYAIIGTQYRFFPRWCKLLRPNLFKSITLITVNNVSEYDFKCNEKKFKKFKKLFESQNGQVNTIDFVSANANGSNFFNEFVSVPITRAQWMKIRDEDEFKQKRNKIVEQYKKLFKKYSKSGPTNGVNNSVVHTSELDKIKRTSLLLSLVQMIREDYPVPFVDKSNAHDLSEYVFSKEKYEPVTNSSPLYSIDCEMCYNVDGDMEIVWLAIVDEKLDCVYESFVKPRKKITNYLTQITGVSKATLESIETDLSDVQRKIREILPPDAILCGQSLNNDLHSLKMYHPYIIDTSVIFNISGNRDIKPSLKRLSAQFLGKIIQEGAHNPVIDAKVSLQLVLLKLRQSLNFGDAIINGCTNIFEESQFKDTIENMTLDDINIKDPYAISKFIYQTGLNIDQNFFNILRDYKISNLYLDSASECDDDREISKNTDYKLAKSNKDAMDLLKQSIKKNKFNWSQFYIKANIDNSIQEQVDSEELKNVLNYIREIYDELEDDTLFMVALPGRTGETPVSELIKKASENNEDTMENLSDLYKGRCFIIHKNLELVKLELDVKNLYNEIYPNGNKAGYGVILPNEQDE